MFLLQLIFCARKQHEATWNNVLLHKKICGVMWDQGAPHPLHPVLFFTHILYSLLQNSAVTTEEHYFFYLAHYTFGTIIFPKVLNHFSMHLGIHSENNESTFGTWLQLNISEKNLNLLPNHLVWKAVFLSANHVTLIKQFPQLW